jgi:hypothetical protein
VQNILQIVLTSKRAAQAHCLSVEAFHLWPILSCFRYRSQLEAMASSIIPPGSTIRRAESSVQTRPTGLAACAAALHSIGRQQSRVAPPMPSTPAGASVPGPQQPFNPRAEDEVKASNIVEWAHSFVAPPRMKPKDRPAWMILDIDPRKGPSKGDFPDPHCWPSMKKVTPNATRQARARIVQSPISFTWQRR